MKRWRMWFGAANGMKPSVELVQAMDSLDRRTVRRVTRLTGRGEATSDASEARLAVALAHQTRQHAPTASSYAVLAVMVTVSLGVLIVQAARGEIDSLGIVLGLAGLWLVTITIRGRLHLRNAVTAERLNLELLEKASVPYSPSWSPAAIDIPPAALLVSAIVMFFVYGVPFGALQFVDGHAKHSTGSAIASGALFGVFMTIFQLTMGRGIAQRRSERSLPAGPGR